MKKTRSINIFLLCVLTSLNIILCGCIFDANGNKDDSSSSVPNYDPQSFIKFTDLGNKQAQIDFSYCVADDNANVYNDFITKIVVKIVSEYDESQSQVIEKTYTFSSAPSKAELTKTYTLPYFGKYKIYVQCTDNYGNTGINKCITDSLSTPKPTLNDKLFIDNNSVSSFDCVLPCEIKIDMTSSVSQRNLNLLYYVNGNKISNGIYTLSLTESNYSNYNELALKVKDDTSDGSFTTKTIPINCRTAVAPTVTISAVNTTDNNSQVSSGNNVDLGDKITFSAGIVYDNGASANLAQWSYKDGVSYTVNGNSLNFVCANEGKKTFSFEVRDSKGNITTKTFIINVVAHDLQVKDGSSSCSYEAMRAEIVWDNNVYKSTDYYPYEKTKYGSLFDMFGGAFFYVARANFDNLNDDEITMNFKLKGVTALDPIEYNNVTATYKLCYVTDHLNTGEYPNDIVEGNYTLEETKTVSGEGWEKVSFNVKRTSEPFWDGDSWENKPIAKIWFVIATVYCEKFNKSYMTIHGANIKYGYSDRGIWLFTLTPSRELLDKYDKNKVLK